MPAYATAASPPAAAHLASATEADNRMQWDGARRGHYEVWYLTANHRASRSGFWIRTTLESPLAGHGEAHAQIWFGYFDVDDPKKSFALHSTHPASALRAQASPFQITVGDTLFAHGAAKGRLEGNGHSATWDLTWLPSSETCRHLPEFFYKSALGGTKLLSPSVDAPVRGRVVVDGREIMLDGEPGGQTHIWGSKHAHAWGWGHCNAFDARRGAALEVITARLKRRGLVLPPLTVATLYLDGEPLRFNHLRDTLVNRGRFSTGRYQFSAGGLRAKIEGEFTARPEDFVLAPYTDPDGEAVYCANTEVGDLRLTVWRRDRPWQRWREQVRLVAPHTAHFEVAHRTPDPAITRRHVAV